MFDFTGPYCTTKVHWSNVYICTVCMQNNLQRISSSPWPMQKAAEVSGMLRLHVKSHSCSPSRSLKRQHTDLVDTIVVIRHLHETVFSYSLHLFFFLDRRFSVKYRKMLFKTIPDFFWVLVGDGMTVNPTVPNTDDTLMMRACRWTPGRSVWIMQQLTCVSTERRCQGFTSAVLPKGKRPDSR